jgi:hypothetical protein
LADPSGREKIYAAAASPSNGLIHQIDTMRLDLVHDFGKMSTLHQQGIGARH